MVRRAGLHLRAAEGGVFDCRIPGALFAFALLSAAWHARVLRRSPPLPVPGMLPLSCRSIWRRSVGGCAPDHRRFNEEACRNSAAAARLAGISGYAREGRELCGLHQVD